MEAKSLLNSRFSFMIFVLVLLFICVRCEGNALDRVPTSQIAFQSKLNLSASCVCNSTINESIFLPRVETFVVNGSICMTNSPQVVLHAGNLVKLVPLTVTHNRTMNFTDCDVDTIASPPKVSNTSCEFLNRLSRSLELVFAVLTCRKSTKTIKYCLALVSSPKKRKLPKECFGRGGRTLYPTVIMSSANTSPPPMTATHGTPATSVYHDIITFIKKKKILFSILAAVLLILIIILVGLCCWCRCCKRKQKANSFKLQPLPSPTSADAGVVYEEPDVATSSREPEGGYDYPYSHQTRGFVGNKRKAGVKKNTELHDEKIDGDGYASLKRTEHERENEYQPLSSPSSPQHGQERKALPLYYVKVL